MSRPIRDTPCHPHPQRGSRGNSTHPPVQQYRDLSPSLQHAIRDAIHPRQYSYTTLETSPPQAHTMVASNWRININPQITMGATADTAEERRMIPSSPSRLLQRVLSLSDCPAQPLEGPSPYVPRSEGSSRLLLLPDSAAHIPNEASLLMLKSDRLMRKSLKNSAAGFILFLIISAFFAISMPYLFTQFPFSIVSSLCLRLHTAGIAHSSLPAACFARSSSLNNITASYTTSLFNTDFAHGRKKELDCYKNYVDQLTKALQTIDKIEGCINHAPSNVVATSPLGSNISTAATDQRYKLTALDIAAISLPSQIHTQISHDSLDRLHQYMSQANHLASLPQPIWRTKPVDFTPEEHNLILNFTANCQHDLDWLLALLNTTLTTPWITSNKSLENLSSVLNITVVEVNGRRKMFSKVEIARCKDLKMKADSVSLSASSSSSMPISSMRSENASRWTSRLFSPGRKIGSILKSLSREAAPTQQNGHGQSPSSTHAREQQRDFQFCHTLATTSRLILDHLCLSANLTTVMPVLQVAHADMAGFIAAYKEQIGTARTKLEAWRAEKERGRGATAVRKKDVAGYGQAVGGGLAMEFRATWAQLLMPLVVGLEMVEEAERAKIVNE